MCLQSLEEEIMFNAGHLLAVEEPEREVVDEPEPAKPRLKKKPGRGFRHAASELYIHESGRYGRLNLKFEAFQGGSVNGSEKYSSKGEHRKAQMCLIWLTRYGSFGECYHFFPGIQEINQTTDVN